MKYSIILLCCFAYAKIAFSQRKETVGEKYRRDMDSPNRKFGFHFLDPSIDTGQIKFVSTITQKYRNYHHGLFDLRITYDKINSKAIKMGANSFKLNKYVYYDSAKYFTLALDTYISSDSILSANEEKREANTLYVFPDANNYSSKGKFSFTFNRVHVNLLFGEYFMYNIKNGESVLLAKGDAQKKISWKPDQRPIFLSFTGLSILPFQKGNFAYEASDFGEVLMSTLFKKPVTVAAHK
jgi:hypothetical protein